MNNITQKSPIGRRTSTCLFQILHSWSANHSKFLTENVPAGDHPSSQTSMTYLDFFPSLLPHLGRHFFYTLESSRIPHPIYLEQSLENFLQKSPKMQICPFCYLMNSSTDTSWGQFEFTSIRSPVNFKHLNSTCPPKLHAIKMQIVYFNIPFQFSQFLLSSYYLYLFLQHPHLWKSLPAHTVDCIFLGELAYFPDSERVAGGKGFYPRFHSVAG